MARRWFRVPAGSWWMPLLVFVALAPTLSAARMVSLWDTTTALGDTPDVARRSAWRTVPTDLMERETDPAQARSDPGYSGRAYDFRGDAAVENQGVLALFESARGRVTILAKPTAGGAPSVPQEVVHVMPLAGASAPARLKACSVIRNAGDDVVLDATFLFADGPEAVVRFAFDKSGLVQVIPVEGPDALRVASPVRHAILPSFVGDDLLVGPDVYETASTLHLPADHCVVGLVEGGARQWIMTWPGSDAALEAGVASSAEGARQIATLDLRGEPEGVCLAVLSAPGLWHEEALTASFLEKEVTLEWRPPFPAKWETQLSEGGVPTTFAFRDTKGTVWRGVPGSYNYPAWFEEGAARLHLSKKIPPRGSALIYFIEGNGTPANVATPVDVLNASLGRALAAKLLDPAGRALRTHHRRSEGEVHRACTCGYTEAIQAIFEAGEEVAQKDAITRALEDMVFFVDRHLERLDEYQSFAQSMTATLQAHQKPFPSWASICPAWKPSCGRFRRRARCRRRT